MQHSIQAEGFGVRLRPVRMEDAAFIVWLRNLEHVRGKLGDSAPDVASQQAWIEKYFARPDDYYFIVETLTSTPVGTHSIYDIRDGSGALGRWAIRPGVQAAVPSHMLAFQIAFEMLRLRELRNATVASNLPVISISRRFGFREVRFEVGGVIIDGQPVDLVHFVTTAGEWAQRREQLMPVASFAGGLVEEWEQRQTTPGGVSPGCMDSDPPRPKPGLESIPVRDGI